MKQKINNMMQSTFLTDAKEPKSSPNSMKLLTEVIHWVARDTPKEKEELRKWLSSGNLKKGSEYQMNVKHKLQPMLPLLLQSDNDVTSTVANKRTLLHFCILALRDVDARDNWDRVHEYGLISKLCESGASIIADDCNGDSPLGIALAKKRLDLVSTLLRFSCDNINETNGRGQTVLHILIDKYNNGSGSYKVYIELIMYLIGKGADINKPDKNGVTPLHLVAKSTDFELMKLLKTNGGDLYSLTETGDNLLIVACKSVNEKTDESIALELIKRLLNSGFNADCKNNKGFTPLHYASSKSLAITKNLKYAGANLHAVASDNTNSLHSATISSNLEVMEYLIDAGVDVNLRDNVYGFSLIHMAAMSDNERKCERLVKKSGFHPNDLGKCDLTPLLLAAMIGNAGVVEMLIEYGADVHCTDSRFRYTALHLASMRGRFASIREICGTSSSEDESSSLVGHCFDSLRFRKKSKIGSTSTVLALLKAGANVNAKDVHGCTPLHYATRQPNSELVEILLKNGAHVDVQDNDCYTPLHNCLLNNNELGLKYLLLHGVDINDVELIRKRILGQVRKPDNLYGARLLQHLVKLEVADLYVHDTYRRYLGKPNWKKFYDKCHEETAKLKRQMVTPGITVYDLLHMNFKHRSSFVDSLPSNLETEVPYYCTLIKNKCNEAVNRNQLIEPAKEAYQIITRFHWPDVCLEHILSFLNNSTLRVLIDSAKSECLNLITR